MPSWWWGCSWFFPFFESLFVFVEWNIIICFCVSFLRYFFIVGDRGSDDRLALSFNNSWEKEVKLSVPINNRSGLMVFGVPCAWFRWWEFLSAITCSIVSGSSTVLNSNFGVCLVSFHLIVLSIGISIVCNDDFFIICCEVIYCIPHYYYLFDLLYVDYCRWNCHFICNVHCRSSLY